LYHFIDKNCGFFTTLLEEIENILTIDKKFRIDLEDFWLNYNIIKRHISTIIIKSLFVVDSAFSEGEGLNFTSRSKVFSRIKEYSNIYRFGDKHSLVFNRIIKLLISLDKSSTIVKLIITKKTYGKFSKDIFLKFSIYYNCDFSKKIYLGISLTPFIEISDDYMIGASYLTLSFFYKKSVYQNSTNRIYGNCIIKSSKHPFIIDKNISDIFLKTLEEWGNNKLNDSYINELQIDIECLKKEVKTLEKEKMKYRDDYFYFNDNELNEDKEAAKTLNSETYKNIKRKIDKILSIKKLINSLVSKLNNVLYKFITVKLIQLDKIFYIAHYYDFRGRIYPRSMVAVTYNVYLRIILKLNSNLPLNKKSKIEESRYYKKFLKGVGKVDKFNIDSKEYSIGSQFINNFTRYLVAHYLLEIGKINKTKLINQKGFITLNGFLKEGVNIINNFGERNDNSFTFVEIVEIKKFMFAIKETLENKDGGFYLCTLNKDSTASSLQH